MGCSPCAPKKVNPGEAEKTLHEGGRFSMPGSLEETVLPPNHAVAADAHGGCNSHCGGGPWGRSSEAGRPFLLVAGSAERAPPHPGGHSAPQLPLPDKRQAGRPGLAPGGYMVLGLCCRRLWAEDGVCCMESARLAGEPETLGKWVSRGVWGKISAEDS